MIRGLSIQNFRNLRSLDFKPKDFNVILGRQGTGKTSVLEAMALTDATDQEFHSILRRSYCEQARVMELQELVLLNFFAHQADIESFRIKMEYDGSKPSLFEIWKSNEDMGRSLGMRPTKQSPYIFVYSSAEPKQIVPRAVPYWKVAEIHNALKSQIDQWPIHFVGPERTISTSVLSRHYQVLQDRMLFIKTIKSLVAHFDDIEYIELSTVSGKPFLMVKTKDRQESVPLYGVSSALVRMLSIIIFLNSTTKPYFLIDDIERGLTDQELEWLCWEVYQVASIRHVQVFLTTRRADVIEMFRTHFAHQPKRFMTIDLAAMVKETNNEVFVV